MSSSIDINVNGKIKRIPIEQIMYVKTEDKHCIIYSPEEQFITNLPIKNYKAALPSDAFVRIHHNCLINIRFVDDIPKNDIAVIMQNGQRLEISRRKYKELKEALTKTNLGISLSLF